LKPQKLCSKSSDIARYDIPTRSEPFILEDACKEILSSRRLGHWRTEREVLQLCEWRSGKKAESRPSEKDRWQRSRDLMNSGVHRVKSQVLGTPSHEAAKWREARSRPSEEDRLQRSRDLANSGVRRVRAQTLGTASHEGARSEKEDNHYIWNIGGPLDPHVGSYIGVSQEKAREFGYGDREIVRGDTPTAGGSVGHNGARVEHRWHEALGISPREVPKYWC
jgi:hypothetical protein